jgi:quinolinate synthase
MEIENLKSEIHRLKNERNAVIVAHSYQRDEVQDIADMVGDSLALSRYCADTKSDVVVFCGVHFMAESAKILSPEKTVLLPEIDAGCPMADMVDGESLREEKKKYPGIVTVCYINSTAEVKAESDICCTSSNAIKIVNSIEERDILFVPDQNLGGYVASKLPHKNIILWKGYCITHHRMTLEDVKKAKVAHSDAIFLVHPECKPDVVAAADFVGSTKEIIDFAKNSKEKKFLIGTEMGVLHKLKMDSPDKEFYMLSNALICPNMKKTSLQSVYDALTMDRYKVELDEEIRLKAKICLERMLEK